MFFSSFEDRVGGSSFDSLLGVFGYSWPLTPGVSWPLRRFFLDCGDCCGLNAFSGSSGDWVYAFVLSFIFCGDVTIFLFWSVVFLGCLEFRTLLLEPIFY